jgi:hypothetical protein
LDEFEDSSKEGASEGYDTSSAKDSVRGDRDGGSMSVMTRCWGSNKVMGHKIWSIYIQNIEGYILFATLFVLNIHQLPFVTEESIDVFTLISCFAYIGIS